MPTISVFFGLVIQMFWREHAPPHFHAVYAEFEAEIDIRTLEVIRGQLPRRALALVLEWAAEHRSELMEDWSYAKRSSRRKKSRHWSNAGADACVTVAHQRRRRVA